MDEDSKIFQCKVRLISIRLYGLQGLSIKIFRFSSTDLAICDGDAVTEGSPSFSLLNQALCSFCF